MVSHPPASEAFSIILTELLALRDDVHAKLDSHSRRNDARLGEVRAKMDSPEASVCVADVGISEISERINVVEGERQG